MAKHFEVDTNGTLTTGLLTYYKLEDATEYYIGNGTYDLTNYGSTPFNTAKVNKGADGGSGNSSRRLGISNNSPWGLTFAQSASAWSIATWFNSYGTGSGVHVLWRFIASNGSSGRMFNLIRNGNTLYVGVYDGTSYSWAVSGTISASTWYFVVVTYDGSTVKVYLNGSSTPALSQSFSVSSTSSYTSGAGTFLAEEGAVNYGDFILDEIPVYRKVLVAQEMSDLYNGGAGQTMISSTTYTASASVSMMNAASRFASATYRHLVTWARTASVSMMNAASRHASASYRHIVTWARSASVSMMNAASRFASAMWAEHTIWIRTASVSMMNSAGRFAAATKQMIIKISNKIRWDFFTWD